MEEDKQGRRATLAMVVVLLCGALLVMLNATLLTPALPTIMEDFGVSATTVQWLTSAYTLTEAVVIPLSAYLLGRFSTRRLFIFGVGIFSLFSLVAATAPNFPVLLVARALQAVGSGIVMPMTVTLVMLSFPREKRGTAMGLVTLVIGFAPAIGPTVGGLLCDFIGWRALFGVITVLGVVVLLLGVRFILNREGFESYSLDVPSVILMVCGMVCLLYGISSITSSANIVLPIALIVVGAAVLAVFFRRQLHLEEPMLRVTVLKSRKFRINIITVMIIQAAMIGGSVILPLYVQNVLGYSATVSGLVILPGAVLGAILGLLSGKIYDRYGVRGVTAVGATIFALAGIGTATFDVDSSIIYVCVVFSCFSFSAQMITTPMNTWGVNSLDNKVVQHANSLSNSLNQVASSIGTALLTALTALGATALPNGTEFEQTAMGDHIAFIGLAVLTVACAIVVYFFVREKKAQPASETATASAAASAAAGATGAATATVAEAATRGSNAAAGVAAAAGTAAAAAGESLSAEAAFADAGDVGRSWLVGEAMDKHPKSVRVDQKVGDVFDLFADTETDGVPIVDDENRVVGYISDGDLLNYLGRKDLTFSSISANMYRIVDDERIQDSMVKLFDLDVMSIATKKVVTLDEGTSLEKACAVFADRKLKKAPVLRDGRLVGSLSRRNIVNFIAEKAERKGRAEGEGEAAGASAEANGAGEV